LIAVAQDSHKNTAFSSTISSKTSPLYYPQVWILMWKEI
jgi:hypothetical protein